MHKISRCYIGGAEVQSSHIRSAFGTSENGKTFCDLCYYIGDLMQCTNKQIKSSFSTLN